ncbi:MAG: pentapeptide repeat-containing protein, partial [Prochlorotrichaceae cyanobacterium]
MSHPEHVAHLSKGVSHWNAWRQAEPTIYPDLTGLDLSHQNLNRINFSQANLTHATFEGCSLLYSLFRGSTLVKAKLIGC